MDIFDNILAARLVTEMPSRLFHYTTQRGLLGIVSTKTLWGTRIQYLNDSAEFGYTVGLLKRAFEIRRERGVPAPVAKAFDLIERATNQLSKAHFHVMCFCEDGDALNLWRGYCHESGGFSIGFNESQIVEAARRQSCFLAPCIYEAQKQSDLVNFLLDDFFFGITKKRTEGISYSAMTDGFLQDVVLLACLLKHPSFKEEHEWRVVTRDLTNTQSQVAVREGKFVPIPYFEFKVCEPTEQLDVEVVVGPTHEVDLAADSVSALLEIHKCAGSVRKSLIPYRDF